MYPTTLSIFYVYLNPKLNELLIRVLPGLSPAAAGRAAAAGRGAGRRSRRVPSPLLAVLPLLQVEVLLPLPTLQVEAERFQLLVRRQHLFSDLFWEWKMHVGP